MSRRANLVWLALLTGVLVASVAWHPHDDGGGFVLCLFRRATGLPCMGCGLTRSFCAMGKGEIARAAGFHALGPYLFAGACAYWARAAAAVAGFDGAVGRFDAAVRRLRLPHLTVAALFVVWIATLAAIAGLGLRLG